MHDSSSLNDDVMAECKEKPPLERRREGKNLLMDNRLQSIVDFLHRDDNNQENLPSDRYRIDHGEKIAEQLEGNSMRELVFDKSSI